MRKVEVLNGQTVFDVAVAACGDVCAAFVIAGLNDIDVTSQPEAGIFLVVPEIQNKRVVSFYDSNKITPATAYSPQLYKFTPMSVQTKTENYSLAGGNKTTDAVTINGSKIAIQADFDSVVGSGFQAKLQESVDAERFSDIPNSTVSISEGQTNQIWNLFGFPRDLQIRVVLMPNQNTGTFSKWHVLSNE